MEIWEDEDVDGGEEDGREQEIEVAYVWHVVDLQGIISAQIVTGGRVESDVPYVLKHDSVACSKEAVVRRRLPGWAWFVAQKNILDAQARYGLILT